MNRLYRILFILGLATAAVFVLQTCKDSTSAVEQVDETPAPAMSISAEAPESADVGEVYSVEITGENADGPVDLQYTLSRPSVEDSSVTRSVSPTSGRFNDSFSVPARIAGDHNIVYSAADGDDDLSGAKTVTVIAVAEDSTMSIVVEAPTSASESDGYTITFSGTAADSDVAVEYTLSRPGVADSTASRTLSQTHGAFTDSFDVPSGTPGTHELSYQFSDNDDTVSGEQVVDVQGRPAMTLTVTAPDAITLGESFEVQVSGDQADGPVSATYVLSRDGQADSTASRTLDPSDGAFSDTFRVTPTSSGVHEVQYTFSDSDDELNGSVTVSVTLPDDNASAITITGPEDRYAGQSLEFSLQAEDPDGIAGAVITEEFDGQEQTTIYDFVSGTSFSETLTKTFSAPAEYRLSLEVTDEFSRTVSQQRIFEITTQPDSPANLSLNATSGRSTQSVTASGSDPDGWASAEMVITTGGTEQTVAIDASGTEFSLSIDLSDLGSYAITLRATDQLGNSYEQTASAEVLAELAERQLTIDTNRQGVQVELDVDFDNQSFTAQSDASGESQFTVTAPLDSLVGYNIVADALGLKETRATDSSTGDKVTTVHTEPVPITIGSSLPGQYPRTSDDQDLSQIISIDDTEGPVPFTISVTYTGSVFDITKSAETIWTFATSDSDPAGTSDDVTLDVSHPYLSVTQQVSKEVFDRRGISVSISELQGREDEDIIVENLRSYASSEAAITRDTLYSQQAAIEQITKNENAYTIQLQDGFSGLTQVIAEFENRDGTIAQQTVNINVQAAARADLRIKIAATDQLTEGYAIFRGENDAKLDSIATPDGIINSKIPIGTQSVSVAQKERSDVLSFEHKVYISDNQDVNRTIPVTNRIDYDKNGNPLGTMSMFDMKRLWYLVEFVHGRAPWIPIDGSSNGGAYPGVLHRATESVNGIGYNEFVLSKNADWVLFNESASMETGTAEIVKELYETELAPVLGEFAPEVHIIDNYVYDHDNKPANTVYFLPRKLSGGRGSVAVLGKLPYVNQHSLVQLLSDGERKVLSDEGKRETSLEELTNAIGYYSQLPSDFSGVGNIPSEYLIEDNDSVISKNSNTSTLPMFDRKALWLIHDTDNRAGEKILDILHVPDAWKNLYDSL